MILFSIKKIFFRMIKRMVGKYAHEHSLIAVAK